MAKSRGHGSKSQEQRDAAILALLEHRNVSDAATACGVAARTLYRWTTTDEAFKVDLATARRAVFETGMGRIQSLTCRAVDAIEDSLRSEMPTVKLQAARTTLEIAAYNTERTEIGDKLRVIEQYLTEHGGTA